MFEEEKENTKQRKDERTLVLRPMEGKFTKATSGLTDSRIFTGENTVCAVMDPRDCLWSIKYKVGVVPQPLKQKFTSFSALKRHVDEYFGRRNILIEKVID